MFEKKVFWTKFCEGTYRFLECIKYSRRQSWTETYNFQIVIQKGNENKTPICIESKSQSPGVHRKLNLFSFIQIKIKFPDNFFPISLMLLSFKTRAIKDFLMGKQKCLLYTWYHSTRIHSKIHWHCRCYLHNFSI